MNLTNERLYKSTMKPALQPSNILLNTSFAIKDTWVCDHDRYRNAKVFYDTFFVYEYSPTAQTAFLRGWSETIEKEEQDFEKKEVKNFICWSCKFVI